MFLEEGHHQNLRSKPKPKICEYPSSVKFTSNLYIVVMIPAIYDELIENNLNKILSAVIQLFPVEQILI